MPKISRTAALFVFLFVFSVIWSQDRGLGSFKTRSAGTKGNDTVRVNSIITAMDNLVAWSDEHIALYNQLPPIFSKGLKQGNLHPKVKNKYLYAAGVYYYNTAKKETNDGNDQALVHFDEAIKYLKASNDFKTAGTALVGKGSYYRTIADWPNTFKCYFAALKYFESTRDESGISFVNEELGTAAMMQHDWEKGIVYLKKALPYYDKPATDLTISDRHEIAVIHNNIGSAYFWLKNLPEAHKNVKKALEAIKLNNDLSTESSLLVQLANLSSDMGNLAEAQDYLKQALALSKDDTSKMHVYGTAAVIHYKNKEYAMAAQYGEASYAAAKKLRNIRSMSGMTNLLYKTYKQNGQYDNALKMFEAGAKLKDSTNLDASRNELAQQRLQYDFEKKELQQKILQQKKLTEVELDKEKKVSSIRLESEKKTALQQSKSRLAQQQLRYDFEKKEIKQKLAQEQETAAKNNWLMGLSGILLIFVPGVYFYYRNNRQKQEIAKLEKNQIRQKLLISQMNPHFIFNSVQNIRSLINNKQDKAAVDYLDKFSKLTRQVLENSEENYISMEEEVGMIENYLAIQQLLYDNKFEFSITVDKAIDTESVFLPPMLTQPFIENAIKHGSANANGKNRISINFYLQKDKLFFEVADNGKGFGTDVKNSSHKSMAMKITKERLNHYTKNQAFSITTENIAGRDGSVVGARVHFEIPYLYEN